LRIPHALTGLSAKLITVALFSAFDHAISADHGRAIGGVVHAIGRAGQGAAIVTLRLARGAAQLIAFALFAGFDDAVSTRYGRAIGGVVGAIGRAGQGAAGNASITPFPHDMVVQAAVL